MLIIETQISKIEQDKIIDLRKRAEVDRIWNEFIDDNVNGKIVIEFRDGKCFKLATNKHIFYDA